MDLTTSATVATASNVSSAGGGLSIVPPAKSPEAESETPPRIHPTKSISFTNGVLKRQSTTNHHAPPGSCGVIYKECLKNHAASMGGLALDGCGEFMPAPTVTTSDPTSLKCAACGCHRNFHRREPEDLPQAVSPVIEYHPHHRHHPLPPPPTGQTAALAAAGTRSPGSQSPPPISSSYYPGSAPHMLLALSSGAAAAFPEANCTPTNHLRHHHLHSINMMNSSSSGNSSRKRFRTKFTQDQKEKMYELAEKVGWKMHKSNEDIVNGCCSEIGVERGVFKVWMHNNKNTFGKRSNNSGGANDASSNHPRNELGIGNGNGNGNSHSASSPNSQHNQPLQFGSNENNAPTNASSSSS